MRQESGDVLDVTTSPDLLRLAEEVRSTGKTRAQQRNGETLALIVPVTADLSRQRSHQPGKQELTAGDLADFYAAAGGWADMDLDQFLADIYASRDQPSTRPSVEL